MDVRETFRGPFVETARRRHARITELFAQNEATELRSVVSELHCLSGEASMLDFGRVADVARDAEDAARSGDRAALEPLIDELLVAITAVERAGRS